MRKFTFVVVALVASLAFSIGCGGGGPVADDVDASTSELYDSAMEALKAGDIRGANEYFDAAVVSGGGESIDATNSVKADLDLATMITQSYFGRAFTNLILLMESAPVTDVLANMGEPQWLTSTIFGSTGYLGRMYDFYGGTANIEMTGDLTQSFDKPFVKTYIDPYYQDQAQRIDVLVNERAYEGIVMKIYMGFDNPISGTCSVGVGDVVPADAVCTALNQGGVEEDFQLVQFGYYNSENNGYNLPSSGATGTFTIEALPTAVGETLTVTLNDVAIEDNGETVILNGTISDTLQEYWPNFTHDGFPFVDKCTRKTCAFSNVASGYSTANIIQSMDALQPLLNDIIMDLETVVGDENASFDLPKELFYSDEDWHVARTDMQLFLAGVYAMSAAANFANSWELDFPLDDIVDAQGNLAVSKAVLVDRLNTFFRLRSDHQLNEARDNLAAAFSHALDGLGTIVMGATGGIVHPLAETRQMVQEMYSLVDEANRSLSGAVGLSTIYPSFTVDGAHFFDNPTDAQEIPYDPFVLDGNDIKAVEMFFKEAADNICTYDIDTRPNVYVFSQAVREIVAFEGKLLHNLFNRRIGGTRMTQENEMQFE